METLLRAGKIRRHQNPFFVFVDKLEDWKKIQIFKSYRNTNLIVVFLQLHIIKP